MTARSKRVPSLASRGLWALLLVVPLVHAANHEVTISGTSFVPNDLTIQPGDSVTWTWSAAIQHDVTADDGSFSSGPPATSDTFSRTFEDAGEVLYHCSVHSSPGRNIDTSMNGRITVEAAPFFINAGLNDAWYDPATAGQGFFFTVWPESSLFFLSWFTFDTERPDPSVQAILGDPGHRWVTAFAAYQPGDTVTLDVELTEGMIFDSPVPEKTQTPNYGTMAITFLDCNTAVLGYEFPGLQLSGTIDLTRITGDNVPLCESLNQQAQAAR